MNLLVNIDSLEIIQATTDTLLMLGVATLFSALIGLPLGIILYLTQKGGLLANKLVYNVLALIVNILRSVPFIILLIALMPFTTFLVGTSLGVKGVIPPLIVGAFPFFTRLVESSLQKIDVGLIHMAESFGATIWQIVRYILIPEVMPAIIASLTVTVIALVSYTAMAGTVGGGGLGDLAIRYGYQRFQSDVMLVTVVLLVLLVQVLQLLGDFLMRMFIKH